MTKNQDFKRLVRARMAKTGESYTAARAQLLSAPQDPTSDEFAEIAGIADDTVVDKTGKSWPDWVSALDGLDAQGWSHKMIAAAIRDRWPEIGPWWAQTVTVGYERIRGLRVVGQLCSGTFAASKSKTFSVPVQTLFAAFDEDVRTGWMGERATLRTATADRSMRLTWPDGTTVSAWFTDKGAKSSVAIQHDKLASAERRNLEKTRWGERLDRLKDHLSTA